MEANSVINLSLSQAESDAECNALQDQRAVAYL